MKHVSGTVLWSWSMSCQVLVWLRIKPLCWDWKNIMYCPIYLTVHSRLDIYYTVFYWLALHRSKQTAETAMLRCFGQESIDENWSIEVIAWNQGHDSQDKIRDWQFPGSQDWEKLQWIKEARTSTFGGGSVVVWASLDPGGECLLNGGENAWPGMDPVLCDCICEYLKTWLCNLCKDIKHAEDQSRFYSIVCQTAGHKFESWYGALVGRCFPQAAQAVSTTSEENVWFVRLCRQS